MKTRVAKERYEELVVWERMDKERNILRALAYVLLIITAAFCAYINLIYGVVFTASQNRQWLYSIGIAMVTGTLPPSGCAASRFYGIATSDLSVPPALRLIACLVNDDDGSECRSSMLDPFLSRCPLCRRVLLTAAHRAAQSGAVVGVCGAQEVSRARYLRQGDAA
jgi:hypothetical protein